MLTWTKVKNRKRLQAATEDGEIVYEIQLSGNQHGYIATAYANGEKIYQSRFLGIRSIKMKMAKAACEKHLEAKQSKVENFVQESQPDSKVILDGHATLTVTPVTPDPPGIKVETIVIRTLGDFEEGDIAEDVLLGEIGVIVVRPLDTYTRELICSGESINSYSEDGKNVFADNISSLSLLHRPGKTKSEWHNVYRGKLKQLYIGRGHSSESGADKNATFGTLDAVHVKSVELPSVLSPAYTAPGFDLEKWKAKND